MLRRAFHRLLQGPWEHIRDESSEAGTPAIDARVLLCLVVTSLVLVFEEHVGDRDFFARHLGSSVPARDYELLSFVWWAVSKLVGYALVPLVVVRACCLPWSVLHLAPAGFTRHLRTYAMLYLVMLPLLVAASYTQAFRDMYPFVRSHRARDLLLWEALYASSFVALELFYRGFMLGMLRRSFGPHAIFVMIVPYCTIHFGKPVAESLGAIVAGVALGTLAMATRSIWGGVALHVAVAWTMDALVLLRQR